MSNKLIDLQHITKAFDGNVVLDDLNLYIRENEFLTLLGPSGCGKTTMLRIMGGFETPDRGSVIFDGKDITSLAPNKRQLNTVFQKYALFPHMSVAENIAFGLRIRKKSVVACSLDPTKATLSFRPRVKEILSSTFTPSTDLERFSTMRTSFPISLLGRKSI